MFKKITMITGLLALSSAVFCGAIETTPTPAVEASDQRTEKESAKTQDNLQDALRQIVLNDATLPLMLKFDASGADRVRKAVVNKLIINKLNAITQNIKALKANGGLGRLPAHDQSTEKPVANLTEELKAVMQNDLDVAFLLTVGSEDKATQRAIDVLILNKLTDIENTLAQYKTDDRLDATCFFLELFEHPDVLKFDKKASTEDLLKHYSPEQLVQHSKAVFSVYQSCLRNQ